MNSLSCYKIQIFLARKSDTTWKNEYNQYARPLPDGLYCLTGTILKKRN